MMKPLPLGGNQMHVIKATNRPDARTMLISFLNQQEPELASFLQTLWHNQGRAITYKELREAILNGSISPTWLQQWQQDYARFVSQHLHPLWLVAMQNAAKRLQTRYPGWRFDAMADGVQRWTANRGAAFVTNSTNAQLQGLQAVIHHAANSGMNVDVLARAIRPMVGLTYQQSIANANYMQTLITNGMSKKKAVDKAIRYAARQHRYRGYNIARTELAFAYNQGTLEWARQAQEAGYLGKAVKVWRSARDERTCETCMRLHGMEIPLNEPFPFSTRLSGIDVRLAPPAHPSCRCALDIEEVEPPQLREDARYDIIEEINTDGGASSKPLTNAAGIPIIIVERDDIRHGPPNGITQVVDARGGITRNYHGADGRRIKQITNHDHGNPKRHPFGEKGEHCHDYAWDEDRNPHHGKARELTDQERSENSDIL